MKNTPKIIYSPKHLIDENENLNKLEACIIYDGIILTKYEDEICRRGTTK